MRILRLHIENFGKLHEFDMELKAGLNTVCTENGWGKSTLAAFIKAMFYGLDYTTKRSLKENERKRYLPWQGGPFGGSLEFMAGKKQYRVERIFGEKDKEDQFALYDLETGLKSTDYSERLGEELFRVDRTAFLRSSFFAQQDFAAVINDSLNAGLTHVEEDAGDMQNYERAMASLEERMKYYQKTGNRGQIGKLTEERSAVRETLAALRNKEDAIPSWKQRIAEKEQQEQALTERIGFLEAETHKAQEYGEKEARKMQHDLLKAQAETKEEQLGRIEAELEEYTSAPPAEEELDRCRENIYHLQTLRMQEETAGQELSRKTEEYERLKDEAEKLSGTGMGLLLPAGLLAVCGAAALAAGKWYPAGQGFFTGKWGLTGIGLLTAGLVLLFLEFRRKGRIEAGKRQQEELLGQAERKLQAAKTAHGNIQEEINGLEKKIRAFLRAPAGPGFQELDKRWKVLRQQSRNYFMLKQKYESCRKEAAKCREAYENYRRKFSEEEIQSFRTLQKPELESGSVLKELEQCRGRKESLIREQRDMHHQVQMLEEQAEKIPELENEEERLSQELSDAEREHELLQKTMKYLKTARENFSVRYLRELQQGLENYMELLAPGKAPEAAMDVKLKVKVREKGASRDLDCMSAGWQDLIQLAERFSIVDALYKEEQPVLILDDPFVNLDTGKRKRMLELLEKLAEKRQMIYFTCREI